jgi:3-hydroxybutyryl-CoA dehydrogenase
MRIAIIGSPNRVEELRQKISSAHSIVEVKNNDFEGFDLIFDLSFDTDKSRLSHYQNLNGTKIIVGAVNETIHQIVADTGKTRCTLYGINSMPTFIDRSLAEMTSFNESDRVELEKLFKTLDWEIKWVESRVGMVTPRVVCMIINEAYYTVQEGTATKEDINIGMKLGTAYPKGPFEWADQIGLDTVVNMLDAIYTDTKDERYKICPLLVQENLQKQTELHH